MSGEPRNRPLSRALAKRRMIARVDVWRAPAPSSGKTAAPALLTRAVAVHLFTPSTSAQLTLLAELGGGRASHIGEMAVDADVTEGDELNSGSTTYIVERAVIRDDMTVLALSEVRA